VGNWNDSLTGEAGRPLAEENEGFFRMPLGRTLPVLGWRKGGGEWRTSIGILSTASERGGVGRGGECECSAWL